MKKGIIIFFGCLIACAGYGQGGAAPQARRDSALQRFFVGHWAGKGEFSNGKAIEADLDFRLSLDSCWIEYEHRDRAPNDYKATSYWGIDRAGQFAAYTFDNFHGHRRWTSNGWVGGKLVLSGSSELPSNGVLFEHFLYEKLAPAQFKMTYEVSRDGIKWQLGDWLVFTKVE